MSERRDHKAKFFRENPFCCFCGGQTVAKEIDHQPAKIIFLNKHRPKGMEFPACARCNRQSSPNETLLALICRMTGSLRPNIRLDDDRIKDIMKTTSNNFPNLLQKLDGGWHRSLTNGVFLKKGAFNLNHSEVHISFCLMAAKFCLAVFYLETASIAKQACRIYTDWLHNQNSDSGFITQTLGKLPQQVILKMGGWVSGETFFIRYFYADGCLHIVAIFHESIALIATMFEEPNDMPPFPSRYVMSPDPNKGISFAYADPTAHTLF